MKTLSDFLLAIEQGASINFQNEEGDTALHYAVLEEDKKKMQALINRGASIFIPNHQQQSALTLAQKHFPSLANLMLIWDGLYKDTGTLFVFKVDFFAQRLKSLPILPTDVSTQDCGWLYASNNKYPPKKRQLDGSTKTGKWMLFPDRAEVNEVWGKIKQGILEGNLWHAKVLPINQGENLHPIMVYTHNYEDLADVIRVLNYLENSGIKPKQRTITYKTDNNTRIGVYGQKSWMYKSDTIRSLLYPQQSYFSHHTMRKK